MTTLELDLRSKSDWIEMFPFGVAVGASQTRMVMIFKDKAEKRVLPIWLSPMDAGIAVTQSATNKEGSPHTLALQILDGLGVRLEKCLFKEVRGHRQFAELHFTGSKKLKDLTVPADAAISFCLRAGCRFFATVDYIERSRVLEDQMISTDVMKGMDVNPRSYLN